MINNLYYGSDNADIDCFRNASFTFDTDVLATFLRRIYNGFDTSNDVEPTMWREILRIINEATVDGLVQGYDTNIDKTFLEKLAHSNEVFSAFKVHDMGVDMAKKLRTDEGKLKPFSEWKKDIKSIASHYCGAWLQTEYNTATLRAKFAAEWKQYEADADIMPNLRWMPTTSANPEEEHKVYWMNRLTLPVGDKFWDKHHPGDHWNCKCSLEQTDEPANPDVLSHIPDVKPQKGLAANPGKTGEMFDKEHPYFPKDCTSCLFGDGGFSDFINASKKHCNHCNKINKCINKLKESEQKAIYNNLKNDPNFKDVEYDKISGGVKATHKKHIVHSKDEAVFFNGMSITELEFECQNALFKMGKTAILLDEKKKKGGNILPALDLELDGRPMDIKSITGRGWYSHALISKDNQIFRYNSRDDVEKKSDSVCLYFHDASLFSEKKMIKSINYYKHSRVDGKLPPKYIKHVVVVIKGHDNVLEYEV